MPFQIHALPREPFQHLFTMSEEELKEARAVRMIADARPGYPCRVSLADAETGEKLVLVNFEHQPAASPCKSAHAIFVREQARQAFPAPDEVPAVLHSRLISARAFDTRHLMVDARVVDGPELSEVIPAMLDDSSVEYLHLHNALPGCYAARITRI